MQTNVFLSLLAARTVRVAPTPAKPVEALPVEIDVAVLDQVSGGGPKGTWVEPTTNL